MAKISTVNMALRGAAVAGLLFVSVAPSQASWLDRFSTLRGGNSTSATAPNPSGPSFPWIIQWRAYKYDQKLSRFFGRPVSPFCRFFCG
ncbi:hypothetical protein V5F59_07645 [Xanthobacter autotrophicus DSM 431]|uniref:hypothetical protein n=1 Tax=Xanthobacter nonsaccharivorans TaxID=3119912 RepID=UPI0037264674